MLSVKEKKTDVGSVYVLHGFLNPEKIEQDIITTLRARSKISSSRTGHAKKYTVDNKTIHVIIFVI